MDDLLRYRTLFPLTERYAFLDHAASAPVGNHVRAAVEQLLERRQREPFALIRRELGQLQRRFKERAARLINAARPDEIVVMPNTAAGINTAANSLPPAAGDNVVILDGDYPANIIPLTEPDPPRHPGATDRAARRRARPRPAPGGDRPAHPGRR